MTRKITDVAAYICENYPHKSELSKTRLTKLVYLADWESAKRRRRQITSIEWFFHNYGPYVDDVMDQVSADDRFIIRKTTNHYGSEKLEIGLKATPGKLGLDDEEIACIDQVIEDTRKLYWKDFIKHVYNTEPIKGSDRYQKLMLAEIASRTQSPHRSIWTSLLEKVQKGVLESQDRSL